MERRWNPFNQEERNVKKATQSVERIRETMSVWDAHAPVESEVSCREYREYLPANRNGIRFKRLKDGFVLMYISEASLESRAHRFKFYDDGNVEYYRQPFNADVQAIPSRPLDLMGVEEIANNPQAADELYRLELELYHRTATHGSE